jgi:hypothetical protein
MSIDRLSQEHTFFSKLVQHGGVHWISHSAQGIPIVLLPPNPQSLQAHLIGEIKEKVGLLRFRADACFL